MTISSQNLLKMVPSMTTFTETTNNLLCHRYYSGQHKWQKVQSVMEGQ